VTPVTRRERTYPRTCLELAEAGDIIAVMAVEDRRTRAPGSRLGYAIVLLGAALFVASCFLPYVGYTGLSIPGTKTTTSLYQQLTLGPNGGSSDLSSLLYLFGGVAPVAAVAVVALVRGERRSVLPALLVGAVVACSLTWIGALLRLGTFLGASLEIGFWLQAVSIGVAIIGTILVAARRRGAHEPGTARGQPLGSRLTMTSSRFMWLVAGRGHSSEQRGFTKDLEDAKAKVNEHAERLREKAGPSGSASSWT
jgi:hypothetical protein